MYFTMTAMYKKLKALRTNTFTIAFTNILGTSLTENIKL